MTTFFLPQKKGKLALYILKQIRYLVLNKCFHWPTTGDLMSQEEIFVGRHPDFNGLGGFVGSSTPPRFNWLQYISARVSN